MAMVRTSTSSERRENAGHQQRHEHMHEQPQVPAPNTRAADSSFGSICSMNGVITRMTNGTAGTRLARITPEIVPPRCDWYSTVASGMP